MNEIAENQIEINKRKSDTETCALDYTWYKHDKVE